MLALSPLAGAATLEQRLKSLPMLRAALGDSGDLSGIQVGYPNGDYFILRPLTAAARADNTPANAVYAVDSVVTAADGGRQIQRLFYDRSLSLLETTPPAATDYDPRRRPWYRQAAEQPRAIAPYLFRFLDKVGTTVTLQTAVPGVVVASDILLEQLSHTIARHRMTPHSEVALIDAGGRVLAYNDSSRLVTRKEGGGFTLARLSMLGSPVLESLSKNLDLQPHELDFRFAGRHWTGRIDTIAHAGNLDLYVLMVSPVGELLGEAVAIGRSALLTTALILLVTIPVVWLLAGRVAGPLRKLAGEAERIRRFDLDSPVTERSFIREVDDLARAMRMMKTTIEQFLAMIDTLAGERELDALLERVTRDTLRVSQADAAVTYLVSDDERQLQASASHRHEVRHGDAGKPADVPLDGVHPLSRILEKTEPVLMSLDSASDAGLQALREMTGDAEATLVAVPLRNRRGEAIGLLCLLYRGLRNSDADEDSARIAFLHALSGFAAVTLESRHLLNMQKALLEAFIKLIAGAIDAKSPYTGGHCQRVPELTRLLAQAACDSDAPAFREFRLDREQWEALHIASWLHDCGKVTTPEYVVDKATKLETLHDRIHEIRMRFEVLKRDAWIRYWEQVAGGGEPAALKTTLDAELAQLDDDFAFVAECNLGGEFMQSERIDRLRRIAAVTWLRTLDDRLGISADELTRKQRTPAASLPVVEPLIADKPEHLIERADNERMPADNPWGFRLDVPHYKYNRGELYNLEVKRGTLSAEERYKINDHMVQTIVMLEKLPYPRHLREVPEIAGCHHETMDGTGYPKRLTREQMSLTGRMLAIADIFEALTAADRPYKKAKTLSESLRILSFMRNDRHIDPDLFELFLTSGVWRDYAERYLQPEQLDEVDIDACLSR